MNEIELKNRAQRMANRLNALGFTKDGKPMVIDQAYELVAAGEGLRNQHVLRLIAKKATELDAKLGTFAQGVYADGFKPETYVPPLVIPRVLDDEFLDAMMVAYGPHQDDDEIEFSFEQWRLIMQEAAKRAGVKPITSESEAAAERLWYSVVNRQGWNRDSEIIHLEGFIRSAGLMGEFAKYIKRVEAEESDLFDLDEDQAGDTELTVDDSSGYPLQERKLLQELGYEVKMSELKRPFWECGYIASEDFESEAFAWSNAYSNALFTALNGAGLEHTAGNLGETHKLMREYGLLRLQQIMMMLRSCGFRFGSKHKDQVVWDRENDAQAQGHAPSINHAVGQAWRYACNKAGITSALLNATPLDAQLILVEAALTGRTADESKPTVNKESFSDYSRSLSMLDDIALRAEVRTVDPSLDVKHWNEENLRTFLLQAYEKEFSRVAQAAFEDFDFGNDEVEDHSGAEYAVGEGIWRKPVFLRPPAFLGDPGTIDTRKVTFVVTVRNLMAVDLQVIEG